MSALHGVALGQASQLATIGDEGHRIHVRDVPVGLRHVAEARTDLERTLRHVESEHMHATGGRRDEPEQHLEQGTLPSAVGPKQTDRAGGEVCSHVVQCQLRAIAHGDLLHAGNRLRGFVRRVH